MRGRRVNLTLPVGVYAALERQADAEQRCITGLAAALLEQAIRNAGLMQLGGAGR